MNGNELRFLLDETSFQLDENARSTLEEITRRFLSVMERCSGDSHQVGKYSEIYSATIYDQYEVHDLLFSATFPLQLERDLKQRLILAINRTINWDLESSKSDEDIEVDGNSVSAPTISYAHNEISSGWAVSCIPFNDTGRSGRVTIGRQGIYQQVFFIVDDADRLEFFRSIYVVENVGRSRFFEFASDAFPDLEFVDGLQRHLGRFSRSYLSIRNDIVVHLSALNDFGTQVFEGFPEDHVTIQLMKSACGIDISPESPQTRRNRRAWSLRSVEYKGESIRCDWHTKISLTRDRIHFSPPRPDQGRGIVVGIMTEHLTT